MLRSNQYSYERQLAVSALNNADDQIYWMDGAGTALEDSLFRAIIIEKIIMNCVVGLRFDWNLISHPAEYLFRL